MTQLPVAWIIFCTAVAIVWMKDWLIARMPAVEVAALAVVEAKTAICEDMLLVAASKARDKD